MIEGSVRRANGPVPIGSMGTEFFLMALLLYRLGKKDMLLSKVPISRVAITVLTMNLVTFLIGFALIEFTNWF